VTLVVGVVLGIAMVRRPFPDRSGTVTLSGLGGPVQVYRDDRAVPQVYADNTDDLFRVQGYLHAQDRFFEMDLRRHITAGRLSELVGKSDDALRADKVIRTMGWRQVAQRELGLLDPATRGYLEAYARGVNDYLKSRSASQLSVSYSILGLDHSLARIQPWTPVDSLAWLKAMAWDLKGNYDQELDRARTINSVKDPARVEQLFPAYPYAQHQPILVDRHQPASAIPRAGSADAGLTLARRPAVQAYTAAGVQQALALAGQAAASVPDLLGSGDGIGSNSWVVSGSLTRSGKPILANDPHLATSIPGIWYQVGLHCRTVGPQCPFDVAGYSFSGVPGVVIGHNARIAWGLTNLDPDVTDFFLEKVTGDQVLLDGRERPLTVRTEVIRVAGAPSVTIKVRASSHGPLLSDVLSSLSDAGRSAPVGGGSPDRQDGYAVALAWTALTPGRTMEALFGLDQATDFPSFRTAALELEVPAQNLVYADVDGHIGYQAPGKIPIRPQPQRKWPVPVDGSWPVPGWDSAFSWKGYLPSSSLPWRLDPAEGFIVAANQAVQPSDTQPFLTTDWDYGFRSQRIRDLITSARDRRQALDLPAMRAIQNDTRNPMAAQLVPMLLKESVDPFTRQAQQLLRGWDFGQGEESAPAAYYNAVWAQLLQITFDDELPDSAKADGGDRWFEAVLALLKRPRDPWWDDRRTAGVVETRDEVLRQSLVQARLRLTSSLGKDPQTWSWGRLHRLELRQTPLGRSGVPGLIQALVNRGPYDAPGGGSLVDAFAWDASSGRFDVTAGPSMRMIVDLGELDRSRWVNQTGNSGHPWDSHYDDQIDAWLGGKDYPWPFTAAAVKKASGDPQTFSSG
jgi:penicillin G amidase